MRDVRPYLESLVSFVVRRAFFRRLTGAIRLILRHRKPRTQRLSKILCKSSAVNQEARQQAQKPTACMEIRALFLALVVG